ncbi:hypothetical protein SKAU_G00027290 [Synaphobranchus kaupii]|uniref:EF-hand domain-containing protein n=1 Tax=Synaphobranchus kaupii TaxID=118154 RepID=A0A9Q1GE93_SYNKA|nr:hypothetical protein SKAU_G00027290 [Synaphobranchus kaupii]
MAETRGENSRVVRYRAAPVCRATDRGGLCRRGLSGRLGGHWSYRGLWGGNRPLQHLDRAGHPAHSTPALYTDAASPSYLSFVSGAVLWDRGLYHYTDSSPTDGAPSLCHRFHAHMNASPGDLRPPGFLSSHPRPMLPHLGQTQRRQALSAPRIRRCTDSRRGLQPWSSKRLQWDTGKPCMPPSPPPSRASPDHLVSPTPSNAGQPATIPSPTQPPAHPSLSPPTPSLVQTIALHEEDEDWRDGNLSAPSAAASSPGWGQRPSSEVKEVVTPVTPVTPDLYLSDFSRPPSSQFSRNSGFSSIRGSVLSGISVRSSSSCLSALASSCSSLGPLPDQPLDPLQTLSKSSLMFAPGNHSDGDRFGPSRPGRDSLASDPRGGPARPGATAPSTLPGQMSRRWPVLPPISPLRGASETEWSPSSQVSCTESDVFEELDAIMQRTGSCLSQERSSSSHADCSSPGTVLSQRADSLVLGCDSGRLGSLSRVQLLLLDHPDAVEPFPPVPDCGLPSTDSMGHQNGDAGGTYRMLRGDWSTDRQIAKPDAGVVAPLTPAGCVEGAGLRRCGTSGAEGQSIHAAASSEDRASQLSSCFQQSFLSDSAPVTVGSGRDSCQPIGFSRPLEAPEEEEPHPDPGCQGRVKPRRGSWKLEHLLQEKRRTDERRKAKALHIYSKLKERGTAESQTDGCNSHSRFEDFDFLAKYCIFSQEKLSLYKQAFEAVDSDGDGYLTCFQVLLALKEIVPPEVLSDSEEIYVYRILEMVDFRVTEGLTDLRLFAVVASLAQKLASLDHKWCISSDFMRSLIGKLDFRTVEMKLYRAKRLFLFLLETQAGVSPAQEGFLSAEQLLVELRAGGIRPEHEEVVTSQLRRLKSLDLLDFLAHLPLFLLIHSSVIANPLDDTRSL